LTFGGIISDDKLKIAQMLNIFSELKIYARSVGFDSLIYKVVPHIYHSKPAEEDLYALFVHHARLYRRDVASTIYLPDRIAYGKGRAWAVKRGKDAALQISHSFDFQTFMAIERAHLEQKHDVSPVHTGDEMDLLVGRFPENIKLFAVSKAEKMLGGIVVYESRNVAHAQYIAATPEGFELHVTDYVIDYLINDYYAHHRYFDFGISTYDGGTKLNPGLAANKESFGARTTVYDFYEVDLTSN
jgi:hypothetical protein